MVPGRRLKGDGATLDNRVIYNGGTQGDSAAVQQVGPPRPCRRVELGGGHVGTAGVVHQESPVGWRDGAAGGLQAEAGCLVPDGAVRQHDVLRGCTRGQLGPRALLSCLQSTSWQQQQQQRQQRQQQQEQQRGQHSLHNRRSAQAGARARLAAWQEDTGSTMQVMRARGSFGCDASRAARWHARQFGTGGGTHSLTLWPQPP